ncbi:hypothetical protein [Synechococcus sp. 1G10]|uniref:hypothetical protein n=1 Tax=Synechococcus sp. 1G10 TaxID=2025605 RepID=UPI00117FA871|nr:hypothetical protein [Synechococcus sp. 1G10]
MGQRVAITRLECEPELNGELISGSFSHWDGLFVIGALDVRAVNVVNETAGNRGAALPSFCVPASPTAQQMLAGLTTPSQLLPKGTTFSKPWLTRKAQQNEIYRKIEIDPEKHTPTFAKNDLAHSWPEVKINVEELMKQAKGGTCDV